MTRAIMIRGLSILALVALAASAMVVLAQFAGSTENPASVRTPGTFTGTKDAGAVDDEARRANARLERERAASFTCPRFSYPARPC